MYMMYVLFVRFSVCFFVILNLHSDDSVVFDRYVTAMMSIKDWTHIARIRTHKKRNFTSLFFHCSSRHNNKVQSFVTQFVWSQLGNRVPYTIYILYSSLFSVADGSFTHRLMGVRFAMICVFTQSIVCAWRIDIDPNSIIRAAFGFYVYMFQHQADPET